VRIVWSTLCFTKENADMFIAASDEVLRENLFGPTEMSFL
jgi:hypothetical protein